MALKSRIQHSFHHAANRYDSHALLQREVAQHLFRLSRKHFPTRGRILDSGCGTGYFHELARSHGLRFALYQLDLAFGMCQVTDNYSSPPEYGGSFTINADMETLPFADQSFSGIFSSLALQWVEAPITAFAEAYRVLQKDACFSFSTLLPGTLKELAFAFSALDDLSHINHFTAKDSITSLLQGAGFSKIDYHTETKTVFHPTALDLMKTLKGIGASYKGTHQGMVSRQKFIKLEETYRQHFGEERGLPASWEILYVTATK